MKRYLSIFMLLCRSVLYKLVAVFFGTAALHTAVYFVLLGSQCNIEAIFNHWGMKTVFGVGLFLTTALLVSTPTQSGSKLDYTIRRLRIWNRSLCLCQSIFNAACFMMFWAVEILVALLLCRLWVNTMGAESHQTVYLAFYRSELLHSLLPLDDVSRWVRNLVVFLCLGICSACGPVLQRRGDGHWGILSLPVLLGILEPNETVILSTHLIEEVSDFIGRAVLIRKGEIVGDVSMLDLEEQGVTLMEYIKKTYHYRADRVSKALNELTGEE